MPRTLRLGAAMLAGLLAVLLAGCNATLFPRAEVADTAPVEPPAPDARRAANGAIFQQASFRPLFEDHRARQVGDILVVRIEERINASSTATSSVEKTGAIGATVSALPGIPTKALARATATGNSSNTFEGTGSSEASNDFRGSISATVTRVLPNGHLVITGEKQIGVNASVDVLRFSGQVDPRSIQPGNTVLSTQVANVRVEQRGRGQQAEAQVIGWLARVFLSFFPL